MFVLFTCIQVMSQVSLLQLSDLMTYDLGHVTVFVGLIKFCDDMFLIDSMKIEAHGKECKDLL